MVLLVFKLYCKAESNAGANHSEPHLTEKCGDSDSRAEYSTLKACSSLLLLAVENQGLTAWLGVGMHSPASHPFYQLRSGDSSVSARKKKKKRHI